MTPAIPSEIWMLWNLDFQEWVESWESNDGATSYVCCLTESDAKNQAKWHMEESGIRCVPKRVFPVPDKCGKERS